MRKFRLKMASARFCRLRRRRRISSTFVPRAWRRNGDLSFMQNPSDGPLRRKKEKEKGRKRQMRRWALTVLLASFFITGAAVSGLRRNHRDAADVRIDHRAYPVCLAWHRIRHHRPCGRHGGHHRLQFDGRPQAEGRQEGRLAHLQYGKGLVRLQRRHRRHCGRRLRRHGRPLSPRSFFPLPEPNFGSP